jgi:hypothetical protein
VRWLGVEGPAGRFRGSGVRDQGSGIGDRGIRDFCVLAEIRGCLAVWGFIGFVVVLLGDGPANQDSLEGGPLGW